MGKIIAMGGQENSKLFKFGADMINKDEKHLIFVGTASNDSEGYYNSVKNVAEKTGFSAVRPINLINNEYSDAELEEIIDWGDMLYVSGGDTYMMIKVWKEKGFDKVLRKIYDEDRLILSGSSAGGICWFNKGFSDAARVPLDDLCKTGWVYGLDWFHFAFCPHFQARRTDFERGMLNSDVEGYGLEDSTAIFVDNGNYSFLKCDESLSIIHYKYTESGLISEIPEFKVL